MTAPILITGFVLFFCVMVLATKRNRSGVAWVLISCIISPLLSLLVLMCLKKLEVKEVIPTTPKSKAKSNDNRSSNQFSGCDEYGFPIKHTVKKNNIPLHYQRIIAAQN